MAHVDPWQATEVVPMLAFVPAPKRSIVKAAVTKSSAERIKVVADRHGMKDYVVFGRIMDWFADQDDLFQRSVLGMLEGLEVDAARAYMQKMADAASPSGDAIGGRATSGGSASKGGSRTQAEEEELDGVVVERGGKSRIVKVPKL